jgi:hypothetical protein
VSNSFFSDAGVFFTPEALECRRVFTPEALECRRVFTPEAFQIVAGGRSEAKTTGSQVKMVHAEGVPDFWNVFTVLTIIHSCSVYKPSTSCFYCEIYDDVDVLHSSSSRRDEMFIEHKAAL